MEKQNKRKLFKIVILLVVAWALYVAFWDIPVQQTTQTQTFSAEVLQNE
ncbi:MAG: hypothetical protein ILP11_02545 [Alphaproteobacteria bacterium]|nr:hypothetical protein [Alphaproteobacteria bacterium]